MQLGSGHDADTYAVVPEVGIQTHIQAGGYHTCSPFAAAMQNGCVGESDQGILGRIEQKVVVEIALLVAEGWIVVFKIAYTGIGRVHRSGVAAGFVPVDEAQVGDSRRDATV